MNGDNGADGPNGNGNRYTLESNAGQLRFTIDDDITKTQLGSNPLNYPINEWAHIVGVRNAETDSVYLYLNGSEIGRKLDATGAIDVDSQRVIIGNYHDKTRRLNGALDEIQIYNRALTAAEILKMTVEYDLITLVTGITVTGAGDATSVDVGSTLQMGAAVLPADATDMTVTWSVNDAAIATIDASSGLLTGVAAGVVKVKATANDPSGVSGTLDVTVLGPGAVVPNTANDISLYYNSTDDLVQIRNSAEVERVEIYSITGQQLYSMRTHNQESLQISANKLERGVFIVRMQLSDDRTQSVRFVK
jgi:hypothetical protein